MKEICVAVCALLALASGHPYHPPPSSNYYGSLAGAGGLGGVVGLPVLASSSTGPAMSAVSTRPAASAVYPAGTGVRYPSLPTAGTQWPYGSVYGSRYSLVPRRPTIDFPPRGTAKGGYRPRYF